MATREPGEQQPTCPECRRAMPAEANFCPYCGHSRAGLAPAESAAEEWSLGQFLDQTWSFFASTRVATVLIFLLAVATIFGSLIEQEHLYQDWRPPELYYPDRYGSFWGPLFIRLGLTNAYASWWYLALLLLCCVSLFVCSIHRGVPLYRALSRPQIAKSAAVIGRQPFTGEATPKGGDGIAAATGVLRRFGYRLRQEGDHLYAEKGRFSRWGPYVIHIGLLLVAVAGFARALPGWHYETFLWVAEGQTAVVPGTEFAVRNDSFTVEFYPDGRPSLFRTEAVVIDAGREALQGDILVNYPLTYKQFQIFQASWRQELGNADLGLELIGEGELGRISIDLRQPLDEYRLGPVRVVVEEYFPDFGLDAEGRPINRSRDVLNPVLFLRYLGPEGQLFGSQALALTATDMEPVISGPLQMRVIDLQTRSYTGLMVQKDLSVPYVYGGAAVVMLGMVITFFFFHRQVWVLRAGDRLLLGARTYKNPFGLRQEMQKVLAALAGPPDGGKTESCQTTNSSS